MEDDKITVEESDLRDNDPLRQFLPSSFGKRAKVANVAAQIDRTKRRVEKPAEPQNSSATTKNDTSETPERREQEPSVEKRSVQCSLAEIA